MLRAMLRCGMIAALGAAGYCAAQTELPDGTKVSVRLEQPLSSSIAEVGQTVRMSVMEDVRVGQVVLIGKGAAASGTIINAAKKGRMGRGGKLDFSIEAVTAIDGQRVAVRYTTVKNKGGNQMLRNIALPGGFLGKGTDIDVEAGATFDVFTDGVFTVKLPGGEGAPGPPSVAVTVTSDPSGAEIEVDGEFVGSTPSVLQLRDGEHVLVLRKSGRKWERRLTVKPGNALTVNATFEL